MFKTKTAKGEETRSRILAAALRLFRERGFDATTMRDVAVQAEMSLGAAYHYFPSKESILLAYHEHVQAEHRARVERALSPPQRERPLKERIALALHAKLDVLEEDPKLLGALFRSAGDARHTLSFLGEGSRRHREEAIALFERVVGEEPLPKDLAQLLPRALWALHVGVMLYFLADESPGARKTRKLVDGSVDLLGRLLALEKFPLVRRLRKRVIALLDDAGLTARGAGSEAESPS